MSLEQKVGQLFVAYVTGATADAASAENVARFGVPTPAEAVARWQLGGVLYFVWSDNIHDPRQIAPAGQRSAERDRRRRATRSR